MRGMIRWQRGTWMVVSGWVRRTAGWWLLVAAALVTAVASLASRWRSGAAVSVLVAAAGVVGGVLSSRAAARMADGGARTREIDHDLFLDARGRLPRVRDLDDPVHVGVYPAAKADTTDSASA